MFIIDKVFNSLIKFLPILAPVFIIWGLMAGWSTELLVVIGYLSLLAVQVGLTIIAIDVAMSVNAIGGLLIGIKKKYVGNDEGWQEELQKDFEDQAQSDTLAKLKEAEEHIKDLNAYLDDATRDK